MEAIQTSVYVGLYYTSPHVKSATQHALVHGCYARFKANYCAEGAK